MRVSAYQRAALIRIARTETARHGAVIRRDTFEALHDRGLIYAAPKPPGAPSHGLSAKLTAAGRAWYRA